MTEPKKSKSFADSQRVGHFRESKVAEERKQGNRRLSGDLKDVKKH